MSCLVECKARPVLMCPTCRQPIAGLGGAIGKVTFCPPCFERHCQKRHDRMQWRYSSVDFLERRLKALRDQQAALQAEQRNTDALCARVRAEVKRETVEEIRRLSVWQRFKLCFHPFGSALPTEGD